MQQVKSKMKKLSGADDRSADENILSTAASSARADKAEHFDGTYIFATKSQYIGQFVEGKFSGQGTLRWPDRNSYEGQWLNGKRHGYGIYSFCDGSEYKGHSLKGMYDGQGTYKFK